MKEEDFFIPDKENTITIRCTKGQARQMLKRKVKVKTLKVPIPKANKKQAIFWGCVALLIIICFVLLGKSLGYAQGYKTGVKDTANYCVKMYGAENIKEAHTYTLSDVKQSGLNLLGRSLDAVNIQILLAILALCYIFHGTLWRIL